MGERRLWAMKDNMKSNISKSMGQVLRDVFGFRNGVVGCKGSATQYARDSRAHKAAQQLASLDIVTISSENGWSVKVQAANSNGRTLCDVFTDQS